MQYVVGRGDTQNNKILIITEDGSHSIFVPGLNEHYHSIHGAIQESNHVFIRAGLHAILKSKTKIKILEMGFGTGLNALLTLKEAQNLNLQIDYTTLEAYPVEEEIIKELNYGALVENGKWKDSFIQIHNLPWNVELNFASDNFSLKKLQTSLLEFSSESLFDLVYFDAFAPEVQPELWTAEVFENIFRMMHNGGILVTYCCKGDVKRAMKSAGFKIEKLPGPPGKREMLRAWKL